MLKIIPDMDSTTETEAERRLRTRVALSVPLMITSLDPTFQYQTLGDAVDVSSNGLQMRVRAYVPLATRLRLDILHSDQVIEGRVVRAHCDGTKGWIIGIQLLEQIGNVWRMASPPADWTPPRSSASRYNEWMWHL